MYGSRRRQGRFGRLPRTAPSLTNTIVSLMREYQNMRDSNIMDAWRQGGEFEGHKVTDSQVLAYWTEREKTLDPNDPTYDQTRNIILQTRYSIDESKHTLAYAQKKISAMDMARFYSGWAKKMPRDSEAWRVLMRNAAQFKDAVGSGGGGGGGGGGYSRSDRLIIKSNDIRAKYENAWDYTINVLRDLAVNEGIIGEKQDLMDFNLGDNPDPNTNENDPTRLLELLDTINTSTDPGTVQYRKAVEAQLKKYDPHFKTLDYHYLTGLMSNKSIGMGQRRAYAATLGLSTKSIDKEIAGSTALAHRIGSWDDATAYVAARNQFLLKWNDASLTPGEKLAAAQDYHQTLGHLAAGTKDPNFHGGLVNEMNALEGKPNVGATPAENYSGASSAKQGPSADAGLTAGGIRNYQGQVQKLLPGLDANGMPRPPTGSLWRVDGAQGNPSINGNGWAVLDNNDPRVLEIGPLSMQTMGEDGMVRHIPAFEVVGTGIGGHDPVTGEALPVDKARPAEGNRTARLGMAADMDNGVRVYGVYVVNPVTQEPELVYSADPWGPTVAENGGPSVQGTQIAIPMPVVDAEGNPIATDAAGNPAFRTTDALSPFLTDPAMRNTSVLDANGNPIPGTRGDGSLRPNNQFFNNEWMASRVGTPEGRFEIATTPSARVAALFAAKWPPTLNPDGSTTPDPNATKAYNQFAMFRANSMMTTALPARTGETQREASFARLGEVAGVGVAGQALSPAELAAQSSRVETDAQFRARVLDNFDAISREKGIDPNAASPGRALLAARGVGPYAANQAARHQLMTAPSIKLPGLFNTATGQALPGAQAPAAPPPDIIAPYTRYGGQARVRPPQAPSILAGLPDERGIHPVAGPKPNKPPPPHQGPETPKTKKPPKPPKLPPFHPQGMSPV